MMLSSTLPHRSWELASYCGSSTRHMEYLLYVRYVWGRFQLYLVFTAFSHSACVRSLMNFRDIWCFDTRLMLHDVTTKLFTGGTERPAGQFNSQAQLGIYRSYICTCVCVCVCRCLCVLRVDLYGCLRSRHNTNIFRLKSQCINWNVMNKYMNFPTEMLSGWKSIWKSIYTMTCHQFLLHIFSRRKPGKNYVSLKK